MTGLYPLKFAPLLKERVWGGNTLNRKYNKGADTEKKIGESWELSAVQEDISVALNGFLEGNTLEDLIEVYMGDLVGEQIYEKFGHEFPLLIKLIDARDVLSIQVHPDDKIAGERHNAYGKTEMWYVLEAEEGAKLFSGFRNPTTKEEYLDHLEKGTLSCLLNEEKPVKGDVFFIPAGRVHAIGGGLVLAEIQQTSDITYRIYDWGRTGLDGKPRELHTDLAVDVIDYSAPGNYKTVVAPEQNKPTSLALCKYFTTNIINFNKAITRDYNLTDSFVIYICTEGSYDLEWDEEKMHIEKGETILIPAIMNEVKITSDGATILEVYINPEHKDNE